MSIFDALQGDYELPSAPSRRLRPRDVADIRKLYRECGWKQAEIAEHFGVCQPQISKIVNRLQWKGAP